MLNGKLRRVKPCFCGDEPLCTTKNGDICTTKNGKNPVLIFSVLPFPHFLRRVFRKQIPFLDVRFLPLKQNLRYNIKIFLALSTDFAFYGELSHEKFRGQHKVADHIKAAANS